MREHLYKRTSYTHLYKIFIYFTIMSLHWFEPRTIPSEYKYGGVGDYVGTYVSEQDVDDVVFEIKFKTGCKYDPFPLGQVCDDDGLMHYMFVVHPKDTDRFRLGRRDTRYCGQFSWMSEEMHYSQFPDEFVEFTHTSNLFSKY